MYGIFSQPMILFVFPEAASKRRSAVTEAETTQVILAQLQHALDRAYDGSRRNDARRTESLGNACVTLN